MTTLHTLSDSASGLQQQARRTADLQQMPNVDATMADRLLRLGIARQEDLIGRNPDDLFEALCRLDGIRHDLHLQDILSAVVAYAEGGPPLPWWDFTPARLHREARRQKHAQ